MEYGKQRLKLIDGLRGIAACMVMFYHLGDRTGLEPVTQLGYLGVGIFFVISGFVIASTLLNKDITGASIGRFFARRFVRLDIPYWVNIAATVLLGAVLYRLGGRIHHYSAEQIAVNMVYLQGILGIREINQVYWTLCLEIQFYLTLVLALWLARKLGGSPVSKGFQWAIVGSVALSLLFSADILTPPRGLMFPYWWAFAFGAMICWWHARLVSGRMLIAATLPILLCPFMKHEPWRIAGLLTGGTFVLAIARNAMGKWLAGPVAQFLGRISYSLYLFHALIGWEAQTLALRYVGPYEALAFGIGVSIVTAWLAYVLVERPAVRLSHRIRDDGAPKPEAVLAGG